MFKKILFLLSFCFLFLLASCENIVDKSYNTNQVSFGLGRAAEGISETLQANKNINEDSKLLVRCELLQEDKFLMEVSEIVPLKNLAKSIFYLNDIESGNNYFVSMKIFYNDILIYKALSKPFVINDNNRNVALVLPLKENKSKIVYNLDGGVFPKDASLPSDYFINSSIELSKLPVPEKEFHHFDGWYTGKDFSSEKKVSSLGKNCFLGDITLYAKWIERTGPVTFIPSEKDIDYNDEITLVGDEGAKIFYTLDGSDPTEKSLPYSGKIVFDDKIIKDDKVTIKAVAIGKVPSDVVTKDYVLKRYSVKFNNMSHGDVPKADDTKYKKGDLIKDPGFDMKETGYVFGGWCSDESCSKLWDFKTDVIEGGADSNKILYAKWTPITYKIKFDCNGGAGDAMAEISISYNQEMKLTKNTYTKSGFEFAGWGTGKDSGVVHKDQAGIKNLSCNDGDVITLFAQWNNIPPAEVTDVKAVQGDKVVSLSWTNPTDEDFAKVDIEYGKLIKDSSGNDIREKIGVVSVLKNESKKDITNLSNNSKYYFALKSVDNGGLSSIAEQVVASFANPLYGFTENVKELLGASGTAGPSGTYVLFGDWPQTLKAQDVTIIDESKPEMKNNWECYLADDNCYYIKAVSDGYAHSSVTGKFDDGVTEIKGGQEYYFKMEPIKWRVVDEQYIYGKKGAENLTGRLLLAEKTLLNNRFHESSEYIWKGFEIFAYDYSNSELRAMLNGCEFISGVSGQPKNQTYLNKGFIHNAFTNNAASKISVTSVDNSYESLLIDNSMIAGNIFKDTEDQVFLLSRKDVQKYFTTYESANPLMERKTTDYSRSVGKFAKDGNNSGEFINNSDWWLRSLSPGSGKKNVFYVSGDGNASLNSIVTESAHGVVPAICIGQSQTVAFNTIYAPKAGISTNQEEVFVTLKGTGFKKSLVKPEEVIISSTPSLGASQVEIISDTTIKVKFSRPSIAGNYDISISAGGQHINSSLVVTDYSDYSVGDVLLNDGTKVNFADIGTITPDQKSKAVAVVGGFNYYGVPMGVGADELLTLWAKELVDADIYYDELVCHQYENKVYGDVDGSDNWNVIKETNPENPTLSDKYPAFKYANSYGNNFTEAFKTGWFVPSIVELENIFKNLDTVNEALTAIGSPTIGSKNFSGSSQKCDYWSSSQLLNSKPLALSMKVDKAARWENGNKGCSKVVRPIRLW